MYMLFKHLHLTAVVLSIALFTVRFVWLLKQSPMLQKKWVKILPHAVDTVLLVSAITLCFIIAQYPFVNGWLTEKVLGVVAYILMGFYTLKWAQGTAARCVGFIVALACVVFTAKVAVFKQGLLFV